MMSSANSLVHSKISWTFIQADLLDSIEQCQIMSSIQEI